MRLFATGLMSRVMGKAFPDDVPLEAKMVTKAIERAQRTVEDRNFEIRKDVLKYDEVMNEQRKIIYRRRQQILDGEDLREEAIDAVESAVSSAWSTGSVPVSSSRTGTSTSCSTRCASTSPCASRASRSTKRARATVRQMLHDEAIALYEERERRIADESDGVEAWREIERRVMLSMIDQGWREHLYEMDYLQEGINLRAMGQRDPLSEWQREGFDMFEAMMGIVEDNFVRYMFHIDVQVLEHDEKPRQPVRKLKYSAPEDPVQGSTALQAANRLRPGEDPAMANAEMSAGAMPSACGHQTTRIPAFSRKCRSKTCSAM